MLKNFEIFFLMGADNLINFHKWYKSKLISQKLLNDFNLYIQHINYPTVDYGDERLRITISPLHSEEMINQLIDALKICLNNQECN